MQQNTSEKDVIKNIKKMFATTNKNVLVGIGDDTAVIQETNDKLLLYTCDSQVENTHFLRNQITPEQLGIRATSAALSDIAAMGGTPTYLLVSLHLPQHTSQDYITLLNKGIKKISGMFNIAVIGGNISRSEIISVDVFVIGKIAKKQVLKRSGAKVGDLVCVTGTIGDAHAGWELLREKKSSLSIKDKKYLLTSHFTPLPRIQIGQIIAKSHMATTMIDLSDGMNIDLNHLCDASSVGVKLFAEKLPLSNSLRSFYKLVNRDPIALALSGGEDYELLFTVPKGKSKKLIQRITEKTNTKVTVIGEIIHKEKGRVLVREGKEFLLKPTGFNHLS